MRDTGSLRSSSSAGIEAKFVAGAQRFEFARRIAAPAPQVERHGAIEQAGVHVRQAEMFRQRPSDGALAARRGTIDGDDDPLRGAAAVPKCLFKGAL